MADDESIRATSGEAELGGYKTDAGYAGDAKKKGGLTPAAEDYLEMIYRLSSENKKPVRICELSECLHVSPSSASRMAQSMSAWGYVEFKRYGYITLTTLGCETGEYLIERHRIVGAFLAWLTGEDRLTETERIEHYLSEGTVRAMEKRLAEQKAPPPREITLTPRNTGAVTRI